MSPMHALDDLQKSLCRLTQKGVAMPIAGIPYWLVMLLLGQLLATPTASLVMILGQAAVFPVGLGISRFLRTPDFFAKDHPLSTLGGYLAATNGLLLPIAVFVHELNPAWTPLFIAVTGGAHFLPFAWLYQSRGYMVLSLGLVLGAVVVAITAHTQAYSAIPVIAITASLIGVTMIRGELRRLFGRG
ncbi:DUF7010 family protein [Acanthopleuribacter pedis]|uniref:Uncharacterized protein n=1 Tax=Acanthopleuribacter pedis TaxID=442870 RepID=A0A8J7U361_9BACT|nr:hypothetical protein [Acanthopleuribacter pedis]MBO1318449.1 hypothetical protein [Acanthopleuribacter pedis]